MYNFFCYNYHSKYQLKATKVWLYTAQTKFSGMSTFQTIKDIFSLGELLDFTINIMKKKLHIQTLKIFWGSFPFVPPPQLSGRILFALPDARAIFLHSNLLCNGTCSVTGGCITYWGGTIGKDPILEMQCLIALELSS